MESEPVLMECGPKHPTREAAQIAARNARAKWGGNWTTMKCPFGDHWHATQQSRTARAERHRNKTFRRYGGTV